MMAKKLVIILSIVFFGLSSDQSWSQNKALKYGFSGTPGEAQSFMDYDANHKLTNAQQAIFMQALNHKDASGKPLVPAPCCTDETAATCCCECNLKRAIAGLAKKIIIENPKACDEDIRNAVRAWTKTLNPAGYAGMKNVADSACYVGRCEKSIKSDACGGMNANHLVP